MEILYEDNHVIVAYKDKGILSQADGSNKPDMLTLLKDYIKEKYNKPGNVYLGLVHRLDINTSGVMVFAKTSKAAARLSEAIKNNNLNKKYYCVVEGIIKDSGILKNNILKDEANKKGYVDSNGKEAILEYKVIKNYKINNTDVSGIVSTGAALSSTLFGGTNVYVGGLIGYVDNEFGLQFELGLL